MIRCPVLEIGRNSEAASTMPKIRAFNNMRISKPAPLSVVVGKVLI
jgi:hypothetical protein